MAAAVLAFLSIGTVVTERTQSSASYVTWVQISFASFVLALTYFGIFGFFISKFRPADDGIRFTLVLILFFTTEMLRAIFVGEIILIEGLLAEMNWGYRVIAGGFTGILFFGLLSIVLNDNSSYRKNLKELKDVENELRKTTEVTLEDIEKYKQSILNSIRDAVNQALHKVVAEPAGSKENSKLVVDELVRVSEDVVRPLSHQLFMQKFELNQTPTLPRQKRWRTGRIFELATISNPFQPIVTASLGVLQLIGVTLFGTANPLRGMFSLTIFILWIYLILAIAKKFVAPRLEKVNIFFRFIIITLVYAAVALFPLLSPDFAVELGMHFDLGFYIYLAAIAASLLWLLALYSATDVARSQTLANTAIVNEQLSWEATRLGAQLWSQKQKLAHIIHKDVQGALISSALKFSNEISSGKDPKIAILPIKELINGTAELVNSNFELSDLSREVAKINELWSSIFSISLQISEDTHNQILADPICHQALIDLIGEFVTNAVKHGKATAGQIEITKSREKVLKLVMQNNGIPVDEDFKPGLGTEMVLQNCLTSEFDNLPDQGVIFTATIPVN